MPDKTNVYLSRQMRLGVVSMQSRLGEVVGEGGDVEVGRVCSMSREEF